LPRGAGDGADGRSGAFGPVAGGAQAREFKPSAPTIRNWVKADLDEGRRDDGTTTRERDELRRLKRENKQLRLERDIPQKAAAWFTRESGSIPGEDSSS